MTNGWYHLKPGTPGRTPAQGPEPAAPSTERFYQEMKAAYSRAVSSRQEPGKTAGSVPAADKDMDAAEKPSPASVPAGVSSAGEPPVPPAGSTGEEKRKPTMHEIERAFSEKKPSPPPRMPTGEAACPSLTAGPSGPVLLQDGILHETLAAFLHERDAGRVLHTKGFGALGYFLTEHAMQEFTSLSFLQAQGRRTPVAARFSLAAGGRGTPDSSRNIRGFSVKFYADDGNFDLLCNHIPVFPVRDAFRFPEAIRSLLPAPESGLSEPQRFWEFAARTPEALHFAAWLYSDYGTLRSFRHLRAYSVNTYLWENAQGQQRYVRYHWLPAAGARWITRQEAARLAGEDPDIAGRELYETIATGTPAEYELQVQLMEPADRQQLPYDPLDCTRLWDEQQYPLLPVGRLVLDRNPSDYRQQVERLAFSPMNLLPGAGLSEDRLLQGRSFIYWDAQRLRLGPDFRELPVNSRKNRIPWSPGQSTGCLPSGELSGTSGRSSLTAVDDFTQAGEYYRTLSEIEQEHLAGNIAAGLHAACTETQSAVLGHFAKADAGLAAAITKQLHALS